MAVLVSFVLRVSAEALEAGELTGHVELVDTGQCVGIVDLGGLLAALQAAAAPRVLQPMPPLDPDADEVV
jgi:hypothetical protein